MNNFEKRQMILTCFLTTLFLTDKVRAAYEREWMMSPGEMEALEVKQVPTVIFNMVVANAIRKQVGEADGVKEFFFTGNLYLLDVPSIYSETGLILPVKDSSRRNIKFLQVFRHSKDEKPFIVGNYTNSDKKYLCQ